MAINALFLAPGVSGGIETYLRHLVPALAQERPGLAIAVYTTRSGAAALREDGWTDFADVVSLRSEEGQRLRRLAGEQVGIPAYARRRGCQVLHSVANTGPLRAGIPHVLTLHDVNFFTTNALGRVSSLGYRTVVPAAARHADVLITAAEAARDEIVRVLGLPAATFAIVPHGGGRAPDVAPADEGTVRERYAIGSGPVVLCVAAKRPHKNQEVLIRALPALPEDLVLVLAGHPEAYDRRLRELAGELGLENRVRFVDYIPDADVEALWRLAACAAFPTRAEGFGLPIVEAMQRGVAVACSDLPVLREVGGDVPWYFDPDDAGDAARAVAAAMTDRAARERGPERAARYTWQAAAQGTLGAYDRAAGLG